MASGADWLAVNYRTRFRLTLDYEIEGENDPDQSDGPRFWLAGCVDGNVFGVRADQPTHVAAELIRLAATEVPFVGFAGPRHLDRYLALLGTRDSTTSHELGLIYALPHTLEPPDGPRLIAGESEDGRALMQALSANGMPEGMHGLGFHEPEDFWSPWCAAVVDGVIASIAFAARLSDTGAELGVATARAFRGRGLAGAATAAWSNLPSLRSRTLFYSTARTNTASQRVAARLGLTPRGTTLSVA